MKGIWKRLKTDVYWKNQHLDASHASLAAHH